MKNNSNADVRKLLAEKGIKHYEAAQACNVSIYTFSHWLMTEMKPEKKKQVIAALEKIR